MISYDDEHSYNYEYSIVPCYRADVCCFQRQMSPRQFEQTRVKSADSFWQSVVTAVARVTKATTTPIVVRVVCKW